MIPKAHGRRPGVLEEPEPDPGASIEKTIAAPTQVEW